MQWLMTLTAFVLLAFVAMLASEYRPDVVDPRCAIATRNVRVIDSCVRVGSCVLDADQSARLREMRADRDDYCDAVVPDPAS